MVTGFLFGAAIDVVIGELPKLTGTEASGSNALRELLVVARVARSGRRTWLTRWSSDWSLCWWCSGCAGSRPGVPGALVLVVGGLLANWVFGLADRGVALVG